jgi:hypothetical protein
MKLTTKLGAVAALALGTAGALSALGVHGSAAQTPPVVPLINASNPAPASASTETPSAAADTDTVQSGDTTTQDAPGQAAAPETAAPETAASGALSTPAVPETASDGPGGHQDASTPGASANTSATADHQFQGSE